MGKRDPRVDAYIAKAADFAKPILNLLRDAVHRSCPDVDEDIKWGFPHFTYKGLLCSMASFKQHAAFGFWKGSLILDDRARSSQAMGHLGRLTKRSDLPAKSVLAGYIKKAMALNDGGVKVVRAPRRAVRRTLRVPEELAGALAKNKKARTIFEGFSPSHQREYIEWITEARSADTRARRLQTALEWMGEGKSRNWKYM